MTVAIAVDWFGPFSSIDDARSAARTHEIEEAVYLALGCCGRQRRGRMQYVGVSGDAASRFNGQHQKLPGITRNFRLWVGEVASHAVAGPKKLKRSVAVEAAEWAMAYFLELPLNVRKRAKAPNRSLILINRWFRPDLKTRRSHRGHEDWPDFIEYEHPDDDRDGSATLVWFGGRRERLSSTEVDDLVRRSAKD